MVRDARQITTPGVQGERTIKTRVYSSNGQEVDRQELSNEETLAPVTQIVKVGTAKSNMVPSDAPKADDLPEYPLTYTDETRVEKINFSIREEETDELVRDARQITTQVLRESARLRLASTVLTVKRLIAKNYPMRKL